MKWFVEIQGDANELNHWLPEFPPFGDPHLSRFAVPDGKNARKSVIGLSSNHFKILTEQRDVYERSQLLLAQMKGWIIVNLRWVPETSDVKLGAVYRLNDDKTWIGHNYLHAGPIVFRTQKPIAPGNKVTPAQNIISSEDSSAQDALIYLGEELNWHNIYKACEALGGKRAMAKYFGKTDL